MKTYLLTLLISLVSLTSNAEITSGNSEIFDNPSYSYGIDNSSSIMTAYVVFSRAAPGRTDTCKLYIVNNNIKNTDVEFKSISVINKEINSNKYKKGEMKITNQGINISIPTDSLEDDCDWISSYAADDFVNVKNNLLNIALTGKNEGNWKSVRLIKKPKSYFYKKTTKGYERLNKYLVAGDVVYVLKEEKGWYYIKYKSNKNVVYGWIGKSVVLN